MESVVVFVTELELLSLDVDQFHFVGRTEADIRTLARINVANDRLDKGAQIARSAMMHFKHNSGVAIVFNRHSFAEIVCGGHGRKVISEKSSDSYMERP